ncbi:MAG: FAD-dependent oxidoreductase [Cellvibrionales bacterium]|jgi:predicted NAD/FAD-binding protein|nr:FAD-dependent oxidoreductase [Cellvibrionales bacterium]
MKIAIIGTGIAGLTAAYLLNRKHDITVFEAGSTIGGHTATVDITMPDGEQQAIDTGFIVYNEWTYPNFIKLLSQLGITGQPTEMSFSVRDARSSLEYGGNNLNTLFTQRLNLLRPSFLRMVKDILRFNKESIADLDAGILAPGMTLGQYLRDRRYSHEFITHYLVPMGAAIWSASTRTMLAFPLLFFVRFFRNHGLLSVTHRPQWFVIPGGSRTYLAPLTRNFSERIRTDSAVTAVRRDKTGATVSSRHGDERFDAVIIAAHSDQALAMLQDSSPQEQEILSAIPYQSNEVVLHTDTRLLPTHRRAWSSWNYHLATDGQSGSCEQSHAVLTYDMNILQGLQSQHTYCVTLNHTQAIDPAKILHSFHYAHPVFTLPGIAAQERWHEINGINHTWFCGAYWRNGFHEDGVDSALRIAEAFGESL